MSRAPLALVILACLLFACAPPAEAPRAPGAVTAFVDVTVIPMDAERRLPAQTVLVRGARIIAIGPASSTPVPEGARRIEGRGKFLMPGLADMHVHLNREVDLALYLARGVTTVRNMWGAPMHLEWRARIAKGELAGPTIFTAGPLVDGDDPVHEGSFVVRAPEDAERAVKAHAQAGYDFVKVYSKIDRALYDRLAAAAKAARLPLAGHAPRAVGVIAAADAGQVTIEHTNMFGDALQREGSPVVGKFDDASWDRKIDFVDEAKLPALAERLRAHGVSVCPTRSVLHQFEGEASVRARLARPESRYVPGFELAIWSPRPDGSAEEQERTRRSIALADKLILALHRGGVRLLAGTDVGNPLITPGFTLHEEVEHFVRAGLTPYEALRTATRDAGELLGSEAGVVAVGRRADLLLVEGDPLDDVRHAGRIAGVMARGRWLGPEEIAGLLARAEAYARREVDLLEGAPPLDAKGEVIFSARFEVLWRDVPFDVERVTVARLADGQRAVNEQAVDPHIGQTVTLHVEAGASGAGEVMRLDSDGAAGRGHVEITRRGGRVTARGALLSGEPVQRTVEVPEGALLGGDHLLAGKVLLAMKVASLEVGKAIEIHESDVALGSSVEVPARKRTVTRIADTTFPWRGREVAARRYEVADGKRKPDVLVVDTQGFPLAWEVPRAGIRIVRR